MAAGAPLTGLLLGALASGPARAEVTLGIAADFTADPSDVVEPTSDTRLGAGGGLRIPLRFGLGEGAWLEASLRSGLSRGQDRVEWTQYDGTVRYYSDDHWTLVNSTALLLGPVVDVGRNDALRPFIGARVGAALVTCWHSFHDDAAILLDPDQGDVTSGSHIDPYTQQLAPLADLSVGLRMPSLAPFAIELEAGYTVSFLSEAPLKKARPELGAVRSAAGLNALRIGVGAAFTL